MPVPAHQEFMRPLLELLRDGTEHSIRDAYVQLADETERRRSRRRSREVTDDHAGNVRQRTQEPRLPVVVAAVRGGGIEHRLHGYIRHGLHRVEEGSAEGTQQRETALALASSPHHTGSMTAPGATSGRVITAECTVSSSGAFDTKSR